MGAQANIIIGSASYNGLESTVGEVYFPQGISFLGLSCLKE